MSDLVGNPEKPVFSPRGSFIMQFFLRVLGNNAGARYSSGATVLHDTRPLSSGTQTFDTKKIEWPLNQPLKKLEADIQVFYIFLHMITIVITSKYIFTNRLSWFLCF